MMKLRTVLSLLLIIMVGFTSPSFAKPPADLEAMLDEEYYAPYLIEEKIRKAFDNRKYDEALSLAKIGQQKFPNDAGVLYQVARAQLSKTQKRDDPVFGYKYKKQAFEKAEAILKKSLKQKNSKGREISLLLHIYTVNNKLERAKKMLKKEGKVKKLDGWFDVNKAKYFMVKNKYDKTFGVLIAAIKERKLVNQRARNNAYYTLKQLRKIDKKYEINAFVKQGLAERIEAEELINYIDTYKGKKPLLLSLTSDDTNCTYCIKEQAHIESLIQKTKGKYTHIITSINPWNNIGYYQDINKRLKVSGLPQTMTLKRGKLLQVHFGGITSKHVVKRFIENTDFAFKNNITHFYDELNKDTKELLNNHIVWLFARFTASDKNKSLYMTKTKKGRYIAGGAAEQDQTIEQVKALAKSRCENAAKQRSGELPCLLVVENNTLIPGFLTEQGHDIYKRAFF